MWTPFFSHAIPTYGVLPYSMILVHFLVLISVWKEWYIFSDAHKRTPVAPILISRFFSDSLLCVRQSQRGRCSGCASRFVEIGGKLCSRFAVSLPQAGNDRLGTSRSERLRQAVDRLSVAVQPIGRDAGREVN